MKKKILIGLGILMVVCVLVYQIPMVKMITNVVYGVVFPSEEAKVVNNNISKIRDKFLMTVEKEGYKNPYTPQVIVAFTPVLMAFNGDHESGLLVAPVWEDTPNEMKIMMNSWMEQTKSHFTGEEFFKKNFNWFLVPHELGHFVQTTQEVGAIDENDLWAGELYANKVAIAFWLQQGMEKELEEFITETTKVKELLGSPAPEGVDEKKFFNENYGELSEDPTKYGYYQFLLYKEAYSKRNEYKNIVIIQKKETVKEQTEITPETENEESEENEESIRAEIEALKKQPGQTAADIPEVEKKVSEIRDRFLKAVEAEGYIHPYKPKVAVVFTPSLMSFNGDDKEGFLIAPTWGLAPEGMKKMMDSWMEQTKSHFTGEEFFKKNFNWFLVPHELGHFIQTTQKIKNIDYDDLWAGELYANKVAVAFWLEQGMEKELKEFVIETTKVMKLLGSPAPEGADEKKFFNENYQILGQDPTKYGYYQFLLYKEAFDQRANLKKIVQN